MERYTVSGKGELVTGSWWPKTQPTQCCGLLRSELEFRPIIHQWRKKLQPPHL